MAKTAKKKSNAIKKSARVTARPKAAVRTSGSRKAKIDPLNRKKYTAVTPLLATKDIRGAIDFYTSVFGFAVKEVMDTSQGIIHAELTLRDTRLMLGPEEPAQNNFGANRIGNTPVTLYILVDDVDRVFAKAVAKGAQVSMPVADVFWGDRCGVVSDPEGNRWMIATHKADVTEAQMRNAIRQWEQQAATAGAVSSRD
jgi:uncharacterized glyoxalase superfamily protein PhnB